MGNKTSKVSTKNFEISDYNSVQIPQDYQLIKLATLDINLKNTINFDQKIKELIHYTRSKNKNKEIDILCLQGIHDKSSVFEIVRELKKYWEQNKINMYIVPLIGDTVSFSTKKLFNLTYHSDSVNITDSHKNIHNIIISKYPIIDQIFNQNIICANININNQVISIYNISLSKDFKNAEISNSKIREQELDKIIKIISENQRKLNLILDYQKNLFKTDINFIIGTLNISEVIEAPPDIIPNQEFINFIQTHNCIDIYRYMPPNEENPGYTTPYKERLNYILLLFTQDIFQEDSIYIKKIKNLKNHQDLFKIIFSRYSIHFFDCSVYENSNSITSNHSIECIFMLKKIEK